MYLPNLHATTRRGSRDSESIGPSANEDVEDKDQSSDTIISRFIDYDM